MNAPYHYVAIYRLYNQNRKVTYLEIGFPSMNRGKGSSSTDFRQSIPCLGTAATAPWIVRAGPPMWIIMPEHYVSPPFGA